MFFNLLVALLAAAVLIVTSPVLALTKKPVPAPVQKHKTKARYKWVCKGNSYMMLKKGFKPQTHGCKRVLRRTCGAAL